MFASAVFNPKNEDELRVTDFLANTNPRSSFGKFMHPTYICYLLHSERHLIKTLVKAGNTFLDLSAAPSRAQSSTFQHVKDSIIASCRKNNVVC